MIRAPLSTLVSLAQTDPIPSSVSQSINPRFLLRSTDDDRLFVALARAREWAGRGRVRLVEDSIIDPPPSISRISCQCLAFGLYYVLELLLRIAGLFLVNLPMIIIII